MNKFSCKAKAASCLSAVFLCLWIVAAHAQEDTTSVDGNLLAGPADHLMHFSLATPAPGAADAGADVCANICANATACQAWTYNKIDHSCWLKKIQPAPTADACCVSGTIGTPNVNLIGLDFPGGYFDSFEGLEVTPALCKLACDALGSAGCTAWTYEKPNAIRPKGGCWRKHTLNVEITPTYGSPCCVSGKQHPYKIR